ncbi:homoserine dehydrogenase [Ammoniphilus oxalaticus]|uniref:Homoserine dehydrogenase n=1 Tax=Ammoniphilus oxalaticus TaxID=66863 RepID=A0A419SIX6_9BACL|nr:homoserine dehydrogenase [Ammoniphilus oxalaticus]RKD23910.1 homoserine dehydrogenase [Ammoniphilus oxalaticus]
MEKKQVKVGLLGLGTVGTGVARILEMHQDDLLKQTSVEIKIAKVLVSDLQKKRSIELDADLFTLSAADIIEDPEIDIVIELIGGIEPTKQYILDALDRGKHVITANKDLMALHGTEILAKAAEKGCDVYYEASVAGGIPILRALVDGFSSDRIHKMIGIVNGTTNYILTKMSQEGAQYEDVLKEAQELGYAEADPTADVEGFDAARKMAILSNLGFKVDFDLNHVDVRGMSNVTAEDIAYGKKLGYVIKLLGIAQRDEGCIEVSVQPTMIHRKHPLASVNGVFNAVYVYGAAVGETMFYGPGAGELPTATAVTSDLVTVVKNMKLGISGKSVVAPYRETILKTPEQIESKFFLRLLVSDQPGVLAEITTRLASYDISIEQIIQQPNRDHAEAEIILITHMASKKGMDQILTELTTIEAVKEIKSYYRVEGLEDK